MISDVLGNFTQFLGTGGDHTPPETRVLLMSLAYSARAKKILETGYDAGVTTRALAMTGADVMGVDDLSEYPQTELVAAGVLREYSNVMLVNGDALEFLKQAPDASFDFIFVDDRHDPEYVGREAKEIRRVLAPGRFVAFHDVNLYGLWNVILAHFGDWEHISLPAISPSGGADCGLGLVRNKKKGCCHDE